MFGSSEEDDELERTPPAPNKKQKKKRVKKTKARVFPSIPISSKNFLDENFLQLGTYMYMYSHVDVDGSAICIVDIHDIVDCI